MNDKRVPTVFIVDDDEAIRDSLCMLMKSVNINAESYASGHHFIESYTDHRPACLILDVRMPGMSGIEVHQKMKSSGIDVPVIYLTGHGDVPMSVQAMKEGALDFIEKPFNDQQLLDRVQECLQQAQTEKEVHANYESLFSAIKNLSPREREVMDLLVSGKTSKQIATVLDISSKTVDVHRAHILEKLPVESVVELVRKVTSMKIHSSE